MSIYAALQVAVGGLSAQSAAIGNISDNLANSETTGYKAVNTRFESLVTESNAQKNDPGGVSASPMYTNGVQGNIEDSASDTSLAISGSGYFAVRGAVVGSDGSTSIGDTTYFTRAGDFSLNSSGYLVNGSSYYLCGYSVDDTGSVDTSACNPVQISQLLDNPVATSTVSYAANLPSSAANAFSSSASTIKVYDSVGTSHEMSFKWTKTTTNEWALGVTVKNAVYNTTTHAYDDYTANVPFTFNDGTAGTAGTINQIAADTSGNNLWSVISNGTQAGISIPMSFDGAGSQTVTVDFGNYGKSTGVTQFDDTAVSVSSFDQNGIPRGSFSSLGIDENGFVTINYDNGRSRTIAQVPVVQFFAEDQLQRVSGGVFTQTLTSGTARYSVSGSNGAGTIKSNALESSNVDIANEFTKLIQAQQIYSANAKTITTASNMMDDAINIIR